MSSVVAPNGAGHVEARRGSKDGPPPRPSLPALRSSPVPRRIAAMRSGGASRHEARRRHRDGSRGGCSRWRRRV